MTVVDAYLARVGVAPDDLARERAPRPSRSDRGLPDCVREAMALCEGLHPVDGITITLGAGPAPGVDPIDDASWAASVALARREVLAQPGVGIVFDTRQDSLWLLDRIDALTGAWPDEGYRQLSATMRP